MLVFVESVSHSEIYCPGGLSGGKHQVTAAGQTATIITQNPPHNYTNDVKCTNEFKIKRKVKCKFSISCSIFDLYSKNANCKKGGDFIRINRQKFCGTNAPNITDVKGRTLRVQFRSSRKSLGANGAVCTVSCLDSTPTTPTPPTPPTNSDCKCGLAQRNTRIVGGHETEVNEYPWQVGIVSKNSGFVWCGGSVISNQWILTAAHCTAGKKANQIQALLGEHDIDSTSGPTVLRMNIQKIEDHADYDPHTTDYDFSLLKMKKVVDFALHDHIRPICLPAVNSANTYADYIAITTGWGTLSSGGGSPDKLHEVDVKVVDNNSCKSDYSDTSYPITGQMLCAKAEDGMGGKDACQGDSGGPLVTKEDGSDGVTAGQNYELIGVVSWGIGCGLATKPGVYARVTEQINWINDKTSGTWSTCDRA